MQPTNSHILDPKPPPNTFVVGDWNDAKTFYEVVLTAKDQTCYCSSSNSN